MSWANKGLYVTNHCISSTMIPNKDSKELPLMLVSKTYVKIGPFQMVKRQSIWVWYEWTPCQRKKRSPGTGQHPGKNSVTSGPRSEWQSHRHADDWQLTPEVSHSMESLLCGTWEEPVSLDGLLMYSKHLELPRNICIDLSHLIYPVSQKPLQTNGLFLPELGHFKCEKPRAIFFFAWILMVGEPTHTFQISK